MIKAIITEDRVAIDGHAMKPPGSPENLACAAVSALVQMTAEALQAVTGTAVLNYEQTPGHIAFDVEEASPGALTLLKALVIGLEGIDDGTGKQAVSVYCRL